ncbi:Mucin-2 [Mycoblastus sanguinarius]|nr:Mucin-2 [Mycoblastus sanguinarius]
MATVGACVRVNANGVVESHDSEHQKYPPDPTKVAAVVTENGAGFIISCMDQTISSLASIWTRTLKNRLMAFRLYSGIPVYEIIRSEIRHFGILKFLFSGAPAAFTFDLLDFIRRWSETQRTGLHLLFNIGDITLELAAVLLIFPLELFSTLQQLGLLPSWPFIPRVRALVPFSASSPLQLPILPPRLGFSFYGKCIGSLAFSPLTLWWITSWAKPLVCDKLYRYLRAALPKPDNPDNYSLYGAEAAEFGNENVPGLCNAALESKESSSIIEELAKDLQNIGRNFQIFYDSVAGMFSNKPKDLDAIDNDQNIDSRSTSSDPSTQTAETNPLSPTTNPPPTTDPSTTPSPTLSTPEPEPDPSSSSPSRPSTPRPPIEITTSTATGGTLHMEVSIPAPNRTSPPIYNTHFSNSPHAIDDDPDYPNRNMQPININRTSHRITALTAYAADSMAMHLSTQLTELLFLPLDALFVRSLALAFLSSPASSPTARTAAGRWRSEVFPLGTWFGMGLSSGWRGMCEYAGKMLLISGIEAGIGLAIWQLGTGMSWRAGTRLFHWGRRDEKGPVFAFR